MTIARSSGWMRIALAIICSEGGCPVRFLWAIARGFLNWIGPDGRGTVGRAIGEFGGDDEGVPSVGSGGARTRESAFVKVAGSGELIGGEFDPVQFRADRGDGLAVVRLNADVDIVSGDGTRVVDGKFHIASVEP